MLRLTGQLELDRCPHCRVDKPALLGKANLKTKSHSGHISRFWTAYVCSRCGGVVIAAAKDENGDVTEIYPKASVIDVNIPEPAKSYLQQAIDSLHAPAGSVMLSASAVDAMLKEKGYKEGTLFTKINKAVEDHLITPEMAKWAHEIRLDANEPRHADEIKPLPSTDEAQKCVDFTQALGEFLFVLTSRVKRGLADASKK